jgi:hypothetical protein
MSTAAQWVRNLRERGDLGNSQAFQRFLEERAVSWWPTANVRKFPAVSAMETVTCQPFVTARIAELNGRVHEKKIFRIPGTSTYKKNAFSVILHSQPVDSHETSSFSNRKPDIPCYNGDRRGGCAITILGDVKGCAARNKDFSEAEVGHILDMGSELLNKEQFSRSALICFLTDGYRFQFFKCERTRGSDLTYIQSVVYGGQRGWQVSQSNN